MVKRVRHHKKSGKRRRGGNIGDWFRNIGAKIKNEFTNPNSALANVGKKIKNEFTNPNSALANVGKKIKHEFVNNKSLLRDKILPNASRFLGWVPGVGKVLKAAEFANKAAKFVGKGKRRATLKRKTRR